MAAQDILSRLQERFYHDGRGDSITAAGDILPRRHETLYHESKRDSITAARDTLSQRQEKLYHGGRSHSITAARGTPSQRHERLCIYPGDSRSGGRRRDSRLWRRGKKLGESGKVGKWESREIAISEISRFFMDFLIGKNAKNHDFKSPPFDFSAIPGIKRPPLRFSAGASLQCRV